MDYAEAVEELFGVPHAQFVTERKRLSGELRTGGKKLEAARLLAIQRPPVSAWVVNLLWREARDAFDEMFATADQLRAGDLSASQAHRESIARLRARAATMLEEAGHNAAEGTLRRVGVTLSALAATGGFAPEQPGCLADDRDPPGFEAIAAMGTITSLPSGGLPQGAAMKPIGAPLRKAEASPIDAVDHEAALRSLDGDDNDDDGGGVEDAEAAAMAAQQVKFAAVKAIVEKQRAAAAAAAANASAAVANRKAAAAAPPPEPEAEEAEEEADDAAPEPPAPLPVNDKFAAAQAMVARQREMAAKAAATVAAAKAAREAAAAAPPPAPTDDDPDDDDTDDTDDAEVVEAPPNKFAAAQAAVAKQRELAAKAAATVAAAKAARGEAPTPTAAKPAAAEQLAAQMATAAVHQAGKATKVVSATERAQRRYDAAQEVPHRPSPPPAESRDDQRKIAERERLRIEVKRARAELHARERAVDRLRTQLESAEIAVATAQATYAAYDTKLRAIDPSYVPPDDPAPDADAADDDGE